MTDLHSAPTIAVLVVEDEPLVRMVAAEFLRDAGFKIFEAANADEAIEMLHARADIHAVFTDIEMPGSLDGMGLAATIKERWPGIVVIVTSGRNQEDRGDPPLGAAFITKPYLHDTVIDVIHRSVTPQVIASP
ncbi:response regulator [Rhizobium phaseoli]|uniref:Response regulator CheY-like domain-containing protein n=1 Tax=Rhizobium phaseoli TaxID=396 RepID=A0ABM6CKW6_9HYPH|nr:response regulator [Rhizobium phaseoli]KEC71390.1 two-component response regulator protein [Rhizobium leguminosarum bv. phaseoli CCGM1]ANL57265.1 response regulator CheY-like domain-containing protein [Rhizobium phaseoli]ANL89013.1 response regulator CheY-like domain-containing protein [Rhizobium phaseoli]ANL95522.1 response regulator CheY-like domain-containing protein [Rhizobium phaseoli]PWI51619.1 response regulator [Rhizobium phaseoli]